MVNIIKEGKIPDKEKVIYTVECDYCHCVFECSSEDFKSRAKGLELKATIDCPCCGKELNVDKFTPFKVVIDHKMCK